MRMSKIIFPVILFQCLLIWPNIPETLKAEDATDRFNNRLKEGMELNNPINLKQLKHVTPSEGFKYFSGNTCPISKHPAMYASAGRLTIVGYKFYKEFTIDQISEAFKAYQDLLVLDGYLKRDQ
jgi:hypothetical protein